ncbi:MAG: DUF4163 domain-containing protein [Patescibacteria group bacterium]
MQKNQKIILTIIVIFFFAASVYFLSGGIHRNPAVENEATTTLPVANALNIKVEALSASSTNLELLVEYPQITNAAPESAAEGINAQLKKDAKAEYDSAMIDLKKAQADPATDGAGWDVIFQKKLIKDKTYTNNETGILSVAYTGYQDTGGAHGTPFYMSQTIDTKSSNTLTLKDLLKGDYEAAIIKEVDSQIRSAASTCLRCDQLAGDLQDLKAFVPESFVLSDQGITFLFGSYDLGSYASTAGGQEVFIDKEFLAPYILRNW